MIFKRRIFLVPAILGLTLAGGLSWWLLHDRANPARNSNTASVSEDSGSADTVEKKSSEQPVKQPEPGFNKNMYSLSNPDSIWVIANKSRALPGNYVPADLTVPDVKLRLSSSEEQMRFRKVAAGALKLMFDAASKDGVTLVFGSGYRSYALQKQFYDSYVAKDGQAAADRYSARPGTSEHQTGLAFDATSVSRKCHLEICFENMAEGKWLASHAYKYGFTLRYKSGKESVTGYQYEPWHFRYVGKELAKELFTTNQTLEEFFGLDKN
jgi:LAS superfamily LD-carboxypeptidase LdcB